MIYPDQGGDLVADVHETRRGLIILTPIFPPSTGGKTSTWPAGLWGSPSEWHASVAIEHLRTPYQPPKWRSAEDHPHGARAIAVSRHHLFRPSRSSSHVVGPGRVFSKEVVLRSDSAKKGMKGHRGLLKRRLYGLDRSVDWVSVMPSSGHIHLNRIPRQ